MKKANLKQHTSRLEAENILKKLRSQHVELSMVGCKRQAMLDNPRFVLKHLRKGAELAGMTVVKRDYYKFKPQGLTAGVTLAQSHAYFHSYPEKEATVLIDVMACNPKNIPACIDYYVKIFDPLYWRIEAKEDKGWKVSWHMKAK
jgi:S-adenosylmethionine/arginine decarboxylase-like enzyme